MSPPKTYDVIFAGGGSAACLIAGRLAKADPSLKILILEAGPHTLNSPLVIQPARYFNNFVSAGPTLYQHVSKPSPALGNRPVVVQTGRCLGGGSGVNFLMYTRASASDYDDWERFGNPGWGSKDLIPLAEKVETYYLPPSDTEGDHHGTSGPLHIGPGSFQSTIGEDFIKTGLEYDEVKKDGRTFKKDTNNFESVDKYAKWDMYISPETGRRQDTAHCFIYPLLEDEKHKETLVVEVEKRVVKVLFDGNKAIGVEYVSSSDRELTGPKTQAYASKLVVVSGGAFGSPAILERSGIGSKDILGKVGVQESVVDLPGVGENYHDHNLCLPTYFAPEETTTLDPIFWNDNNGIETYSAKWVSSGGKGLMAHNSIDGGIKIRPTASDLEELGEDFKGWWEEKFAHANAVDKPVCWMGVADASLAPRPPGAPNVGTGKFYTCGFYVEYPRSTGRLHITSPTNPFQALDFEPGYLNEAADVVLCRWAYKKTREYARRMQSYRGPIDILHPNFSKDSEAAIRPSGVAVPGQTEHMDKPVAIGEKDIKWTEEDDKKIDEYMRNVIATTWHSLGTCAMKPREQGGVVDSKLNVYGTQNLKVADLSIAPSNVGANTYNSALIIGEKAAVIIAAELGIKGV